MSGGDQPQQTQTTQQILSPQQNELMNLALPGVREFAANVPQRYQGNTIAGFDPYQTAGQEQVLAAAGTQGALAGTAATTATNLTGRNYTPDLQTLDNTSRLDAAITSATRPIGQELAEVALPAVRGGAITTGGFGGSRQGIAEGLASGRASQAIGDTASKLSFSAYDTDVKNRLANYQTNLTASQNAEDTNVRTQLAALGLLPQVQQMQTVPGATTSAVGDVRQGMAQRQLDASIQGYNYDQLAPFLQSKEIMSLLAGIPGGGVQSTANNPKTGPTAMTALGGAAAGASLGTALFPGVGTAVGAGAGALLPFVMG